MNTNTIQTWQPASQPPESDPGTWSRSVIVLMSNSEVARLKFFHPESWDVEGVGIWQRLPGTKPGVEPIFWIDPPKREQN